VIEVSETTDLDTLQKSLERALESAYPAILHYTRVVGRKEGKFLAVIVPGSSKGPHFSGPAYIRTGSITIKANEQAYEKILDRQDRKVREILKLKNKRVKVLRTWANPSSLVGRIAGEFDAMVLDCDAFVVKLKVMGSDQPTSFPLEHVVIGHDAHTNSATLEVPQA
jgi:hypothetical protein